MSASQLLNTAGNLDTGVAKGTLLASGTYPANGNTPVTITPGITVSTNVAGVWTPIYGANQLFAVVVASGVATAGAVAPVIAYPAGGLTFTANSIAGDTNTYRWFIFA